MKPMVTREPITPGDPAGGWDIAIWPIEDGGLAPADRMIRITAAEIPDLMVALGVQAAEIRRLGRDQPSSASGSDSHQSSSSRS